MRMAQMLRKQGSVPRALSKRPDPRLLAPDHAKGPDDVDNREDIGEQGLENADENPREPQQLQDTAKAQVCNRRECCASAQEEQHGEAGALRVEAESARRRNHVDGVLYDAPAVYEATFVRGDELAGDVTEDVVPPCHEEAHVHVLDPEGSHCSGRPRDGDEVAVGGILGEEDIILAQMGSVCPRRTSSSKR